MLRIPNFIGSILQALLATVVLLIILETACWMFHLPRGACYFAEALIDAEKLNPHKPQDEYRIFTFGESTMYGAHYAPRSSPARWLAAYLRDFLPNRKTRVVNFARYGRGSDFTYHIFKETLDYKPDIAIFYMGHNDFLPHERKDFVEADNHEINHVLYEWIKESRFISACIRPIIRLQMKRKHKKFQERMGNAVIESPLHLGPAEQFAAPRTENLYWENIKFFDDNVHRIIRLAQKNHVRLIFMEPISNLKDFEPHLSMHLIKLTPESLSRWEKLYDQGQKAEDANNWAEALSDYQLANQIDPTFAHLSFRLAKAYFRQGDIDLARQFFENARDNDVLPFRATKDILNIIYNLEKNENIPVIHTEKVFAPYQPGGIMGEPLIEDNVHFSLPGHSYAGRAMAEAIYAQGWIAPKSEWHFDRSRSFDEISAEWNLNDIPYRINAYIQVVDYYGRHFDNRIRYAEMALAISPDDPHALRALAWTYWLQGEKENALPYYEKLSRVSPEQLNEVFRTQPDVLQFVTSHSQKTTEKPDV